MPQAFEELAAREIDSLYQGALFLTCGDQSDAERLLLSAVKKAFHAFPAHDGEEADGRWFEARLAEEFLRDVGAGSASPEPPTSRSTVGMSAVGRLEVGVADLHRAAATVPEDARAALWLVVLRRWSYDEAAAVIRLERDRLRDLLQHRHAFVAEALKRRTAKNGTEDQ